MFRPVYLRLQLLAVCGVAFSPLTASAGWICIKNETKLTVVIQEVPDRPVLKRGKRVKLLPGEVYREYQPTDGERKVQVFDARDPAKPLCTTKIDWSAKGDMTLKLEQTEKVVRLAPVKPPVPPVVQVGSAQPPKR